MKIRIGCSGFVDLGVERDADGRIVAFRFETNDETSSSWIEVDDARVSTNPLYQAQQGSTNPLHQGQCS